MLQKGRLKNIHDLITRLNIMLIVIEPTWYWVKHKLVHQRKKTEDLEVDSHILSKWIFYQDVKVFDYEKFFSTSDSGKIKYQI